MLHLIPMNVLLYLDIIAVFSTIMSIRNVNNFLATLCPKFQTSDMDSHRLSHIRNKRKLENNIKKKSRAVILRMNNNPVILDNSQGEEYGADSSRTVDGLSPPNITCDCAATSSLGPVENFCKSDSQGSLSLSSLFASPPPAGNNDALLQEVDQLSDSHLRVSPRSPLSTRGIFHRDSEVHGNTETELQIDAFLCRVDSAIVNCDSSKPYVPTEMDVEELKGGQTICKLYNVIYTFVLFIIYLFFVFFR